MFAVLGAMPICGLFFARKSSNLKESAWAGNFLMIIGLLMLLFLIWIYAMGSAANSHLTAI
jgi:hypothetical protein